MEDEDAAEVARLVDAAKQHGAVISLLDLVQMVFHGWQRFIPAELLPLFEQIGPRPPSAEPAGATAAQPRIDVAAAARALWA